MSDAKILDYMRNHPFFKDLAPEHLEFLADCAEERTIESGAAVFIQGDRADKFFVLLEGHVTVEVPALTGPTLEIQNLGADKILGWSWLIEPYEWDFQARAKKDSRLLQFDGSRVLERCESDPAFGYQVFKMFTVLMSERLHSARRTMMANWRPAGFA